jgi:hypothetical protein
MKSWGQRAQQHFLERRRQVRGVYPDGSLFESAHA